MRVIFAPFPKTKLQKVIVWLLIFVVFVTVLLLIRPGTPVINKEDIIKAVYKTQQQEHYRWQIKCDITFKGVNNTLSDVQGEKNKQSFRITGTFMKTPLEVIQINNITYRHDPITKSWIVIKDNDISSEEVLNTELNPVAALSFADIKSFSFKGNDYINNNKAYRVELVPEVSNQYLAKYWQDFNYVLSLDRSKEDVLGFEVTAKSKQDPTGKVHMKVFFDDYGKKIDIKAPIG